MLKVFQSILIIILISFTVHNLLCQNINWYHDDVTTDQPYNIGTQNLYDSIIKDRKGKPVVVAVIDSGVDIEHEDLAKKIWINDDEVQGNGIDDDNNGYIDDINGWNFIGGKDGRQVGGDTYEMTRAYIQLKKKYENFDPETLDENQIIEYNLYNEYARKIESETKNNKAQYEEYKSAISFYENILRYMRDFLGESKINEVMIDSFKNDVSREAHVAVNVIDLVSGDLGYQPSFDEIQNLLLPPGLYETRDYYGAKWKYNYNPDYDSREIVGDNYEDLTDRSYGNNSVEGPDAMHGTHVSGIIAAERNNGIGMDGVASTAQIMVLRAVPNGDERDKDVANAIFYAVDNGASVINMSFGKGLSPYKEYVDDAVRYAEKHDVLMIHAAGNSSVDIDVEANYPNDTYAKPKGFLFWKKKKSKAWISVGAVTNKNNEGIVASFSNFGNEDVDIFAPGENMYSTVPDNQYQIQQGTSMASPVVAGVAALIRSYFSELTAIQVKEVLLSTSTPLNIKVKQPGSESLVPFEELSVSNGMVNAKAAFIKASQTKGKKKIKDQIRSNA